jgi:hypothetical protein
VIHSTFLPRVIRHCVAIGLFAGCVGACSASGSAWKEEVLLHDGRKMVVKRSQTYRGRSEPGQSGPISEHRITFTPPGSGQRITWVSEFDDKIGRMNLLPVALHILNQTPYVVAKPNLCLSYRKWGSPNPPYVIFEHNAGSWKRIPLSDLPGQFTTINLVLSIQQVQADEMGRSGLITPDRTKDMNIDVYRPELRKLLRAPLPDTSINEMCPRISSGPKAPN